MQGQLYVNENGRVALADFEFHCGDTLEVEINGVFVPTRVVHGNDGYFLVGLSGWHWLDKKARIAL